MKLFHLSLATLLIRFYLMMAIIILAGFTGLWYVAILALPVFFSALMGMEISRPRPGQKPETSGKPSRSVQPRQISAHA